MKLNNVRYKNTTPFRQKCLYRMGHRLLSSITPKHEYRDIYLGKQYISFDLEENRASVSITIGYTGYTLGKDQPAGGLR